MISRARREKLSAHLPQLEHIPIDEDLDCDVESIKWRAEGKGKINVLEVNCVSAGLNFQLTALIVLMNISLWKSTDQYFLLK